MVSTLRDYAGNIGVSYEAVRQQVKRYSKELEGHIYYEGRTQYLDEEAMAFLETKRAKNPVVVYDKGRDEALREAEAEIAQLEEQLSKAKDNVIALQNRLLLSENAQAKLEAAETVRLALTEARDDARKLAEKREEEAQAAQREAERLRSENARMAEELAKISGMGMIKRMFYKPQKGE